MGSSAASIVGEQRGTLIEVPTTTLDQFAYDRQLDRIDFIKIDVEGAEVEILQSSRDLLARFKPKLIIEPHMVGPSLTTEPCCQILRAIGGYQVQVIEQHGLSLPLILATPLSSQLRRPSTATSRVPEAIPPSA